MNSQIEFQSLLREHGAVLIRDKKHLVYRLQNGKNFVCAKTPDNPDVVARNNVHNLRRVLGIVHAPKETEQNMPIDNAGMTPRAPSPPLALTPPGAPKLPDKPPELANGPTQASLKERINGAIAAEEVTQEKLLAEAQVHERRVQMLKALLPFADDPAVEESLRTVLPVIRPPAPPPRPAPPPPPDRITKRVQVTRQLVLAATQTFNSEFTVNEVLDLMSGGGDIEHKERVRVRSSIVQSMLALYERGELIKADKMLGKQSLWMKAPNGSGNRRQQ